MNYCFRQFVYIYAGYVGEINFCFFFVFPLCFILFLFPFVSFHSIPCSQLNKLQFLCKLMEALHRSELGLGSYLTLYASGYRMSRFAQVSQTDSCHYSKYIFHVQPHRGYPAPTGLVYQPHLSGWKQFISAPFKQRL